jgi:ribosomal protein S18 acetylase RimI-like enzyme
MSEEHVRRLRAASNPRRARPDDAAALTQLLSAAFLNDPVMNWIARPDSRRAAGLEAFFFRLLDRRAIPAGEVWMSDDGLACAVWMPPGKPAWPAGAVAQLKLLPMFLRVCGFGRMLRGAAMSAAMEKAHPHDEHFYLFFMAVDLRFQGMGLGSALLDATLKRTDEAGLPTYLENSNPKNARLYERAGFVARKDIAPEGAPPLIPMWRTAS